MEKLIKIKPIASASISKTWERVIAGVDIPEAAFGPEYKENRPRLGENYFLLYLDDDCTGMAFTKAPSPTTRIFGFGLFKEFQGKKLGPPMRDAIIKLCFSAPEIQKVETEVYTSNEQCLKGLVKNKVMTLEGTQRDTIEVRGILFNRLLFGLTKLEAKEKGLC